MDYLERKYLLILGNQLDLFKDAGNGVYVCRCPICNDSKKNKTKTRGYFFEMKDSYFFKCHNCQISMSFNSLLKQVSPSLHEQYRFEKYRPSETVIQDIIEEHIDIEKYIKPKSNKLRMLVDDHKDDVFLESCIPLFTVDETHPVKKYLISRKIDIKRIDTLFYLDDLTTFTKKLKNYADKNFPKDSAVAIPFRDENGVLEFVQLRTMNTPSMRYITIDMGNGGSKIYGREFIDKSKPVYVVEGPFDSMFIENGIACAGASLLSYSKYLHETYKDVVFVFDSDYQDNRIVFSQLKKGMDNAEKIVIYDKHVIMSPKIKDINDMVKELKLTTSQLMEYLETRTFMGLKAKIELSKFNLHAKEQHLLCQNKNKNSIRLPNRSKINAN